MHSDAIWLSQLELHGIEFRLPIRLHIGPLLPHPTPFLAETNSAQAKDPKAIESTQETIQEAEQEKSERTSKATQTEAQLNHSS